MFNKSFPSTLMVLFILIASGCSSDAGNSAPTITTSRGDIVLPGDIVELVGQATDEDGSIASYQWVQTEGPTVDILDADQPKAVFVAPSLKGGAELVFQFFATDDLGKSDSSYVTMLVTSFNTPPNTAIIVSNSASGGENVALLGQASDIDGSIEDVAWTQTSGPSVDIVNAKSVTAEFIAPLLTQDTLITFEFSATDDNGDTDTSSASVNILAESVPPIIPENIAPLTAVNSVENALPGQTISLLGQASDVDGTVVSYLWQQSVGTAVTIENSNSALAQFVAPSLTEESEFVFEFTATDDDGATHTSTLSIQIAAANLEPIIVANATPVTTVNAEDEVISGQTATLIGQASDSDGNVTTLLWQQTNGVTVALEDENTATAQFLAPSVTENSKVTFEFTATDDDGAISTSTITLTIVAVDTTPTEPENSAPIASANAVASALPGETVTLLGQASDIDGNITAFSWQQSSGPAVSILDSTLTAAHFIAPSLEDDTVLTFEFSATDDDDASATANVSVTIVAAEVEPVIVPNVAPSTSVNAITEAEPEQLVALLGQASDVDGTVESFLWQQISGSTVTIENSSADNAQFIAPILAEEEQLTFEFTAADNEGASHSSSITITIFAVNMAPTTSVDSTSPTAPGQTVTLVGQAIDTDGHIASVAWQQTGGPSVAIENPDSIFAKFLTPSIDGGGDLTFDFTATDNDGDSHTSSVSLTVLPGNSPPIITVETVNTAFPGQTVLLTAQATDSDGSISNVSWQQKSGLSVSLSNANTSNSTFLVPEVSESSTLVFQFSATDNESDTTSSLVFITIEDFSPKAVKVSIPSYFDDDAGVCIDTDNTGECSERIESKNSSEQFVLDKPAISDVYSLILTSNIDSPLLTTTFIDISSTEDTLVNMSLLSSISSAYYLAEKNNDSGTSLSIVEEDFATALGVEVDNLVALPEENLITSQHELLIFSAIELIVALSDEEPDSNEDWFSVYNAIANSLMSDENDLTSLNSELSDIIATIDSEQLTFANDLYLAIKDVVLSVDTLDDIPEHLLLVDHFINRWANEALIEPSLFSQNIIDAYESCADILCTPTVFSPEFSVTENEGEDTQTLIWSEGEGSPYYRISIYQGEGDDKVLTQTLDVKTATVSIALSNEVTSYTAAEIINGIVGAPSEAFVIEASNAVIGSCAIE